MNYEKVLKEKILPDLERGRQNWDGPHTLAVVDYVKQIIDSNPQLSLDRDVLVVAAYAHDWGYSKTGVSHQSLSLNDVQNVKADHMKIGAQQLAHLLKDPVFSFLTDKQKQRAVHLVSVHDQLDSVDDMDERVLVEADTLGALDVTKVEPTYNKIDSERYRQSTNRKRWPLFVTDFGKKKYRELFSKHEQYYDK